MNKWVWMNEWVCVPPSPLIQTYRELLVQFSFKSAGETSECYGQVADSQWQRVPDRRAGRGEAAWSILCQSTACNCQIVTGSRTEMLTTSCRVHCTSCCTPLSGPDPHDPLWCRRVLPNARDTPLKNHSIHTTLNTSLKSDKNAHEVPTS